MEKNYRQPNNTVSLSGDTQNLSGCSPVQPAPGDPALAGGLD